MNLFTLCLLTLQRLGIDISDVRPFIEKIMSRNLDKQKVAEEEENDPNIISCNLV